MEIVHLCVERRDVLKALTVAAPHDRRLPAIKERYLLEDGKKTGATIRTAFELRKFQ